MCTILYGDFKFILGSVNMSDRIVALTVVLERDMKDEECHSIIKAIEMVRGVVKVSTEKADSTYYSARMTVKHEMMQKVFNLFKEE